MKVAVSNYHENLMLDKSCAINLLQHILHDFLTRHFLSDESSVTKSNGDGKITKKSTAIEPVNGSMTTPPKKNEAPNDNGSNNQNPDDNGSKTTAESNANERFFIRSFVWIMLAEFMITCVMDFIL